LGFRERISKFIQLSVAARRDGLGMPLVFSEPVKPGKNGDRRQDLVAIPRGLDRAGCVEGQGVEPAVAQPRLLVTDNQSLFRAGLARLLAADARLRVVNPAEDGLDTVERMLRLTPDVVLMDLHLPGSEGPYGNGSSAESTTFKVVVLAADFNHDAVRAILHNGPNGDFGEDVLPDGAVTRILALYASKDPAAPAHRAEVSKRELSVLTHVAAGQSNKQIGYLLGISQKTVRNHLTRIFHKLRANNRTEAVMNAVRLGLLAV
jgi:DNA-binding NarL/FixJ family response regulator